LVQTWVTFQLQFHFSGYINLICTWI